MAEFLPDLSDDDELSKSLFCSQANIWYPVFKQATIPCKIIKLPRKFVDYLQDENKFESSEEDEITLGKEIIRPSFPKLESEIAKCIASLGGHVFPKLNWSSPSDAAWIRIGNSMKCEIFSDICDLLKASDTIATFDLSENIIGCVLQSAPSFRSYLVLREWREIESSLEFRVFVRNSYIIAISQRNSGDYYPFLSAVKMDVLKMIEQFFYKNIQSNLIVPSCVFDCYLQSDLMKVTLIDFAPFNELTSALLFTWEELNKNWDGVKIRFTEAQGIQPSGKHATGKIPKDFIDIVTGEDPEKLKKIMELTKDDFQKLKTF